MSALDDVVRRAGRTVAWQRDVDEAAAELEALRDEILRLRGAAALVVNRWRGGPFGTEPRDVRPDSPTDAAIASLAEVLR